MQPYAHPEVLVTTDWLADKLSDPSVRVVEVDVDTSAYNLGHLLGALAWNWTTQLCDTLRREILSKAQLEALLSEGGITPETTIVIYGDNNNWFAAWAFRKLRRADALRFWMFAARRSLRVRFSLLPVCPKPASVAGTFRVPAASRGA